jgi:hypothetical protein
MAIQTELDRCLNLLVTCVFWEFPAVHRGLNCLEEQRIASHKGKIGRIAGPHAPARGSPATGRKEQLDEKKFRAIRALISPESPACFSLTRERREVDGPSTLRHETEL